MVAAGILTVMYMVRAWQRIFQQNPLPGTVATKDRRRQSHSRLSANLRLPALGHGILAEPMIQLISETVRQLGDPQIYIPRSICPRKDA